MKIEMKLENMNAWETAGMVIAVVGVLSAAVLGFVAGDDFALFINSKVPWVWRWLGSLAGLALYPR